MKICIFSDIHGNQFSFQVALPQILSEKADYYYFLGDICGYFFAQRETYEMIKTIPRLKAVLGNHDMLFLNIVNGKESLLTEYTRRYGRSMEYLLGQDFQELYQWLTKLQNYDINEETSCFACHGSPWNNLEEYIYPDSPLKRFRSLTHNFILMGHTHYPMVHRLNRKIIINPGSIGQPRHGGPPTYAIVNIKKRKIKIREIKYNKNKLVMQVQTLDSDNQYLKNIIWR